MTLDDALLIATALHSEAVPDGVAKLAGFVVDALAAAQPCGLEAPTMDASDGTPLVVIPDQWAGFCAPTEARAMAAMLLRAADQADAVPDEDDADAAPKDSE